MFIFGLSGKRGAGKTTLAGFLVRNHGFTSASFAAALKRRALELFPFSVSDINDPKKKESKWGKYDWTPRDFMIGLGELMRYYDKNYWVETALDDIDVKSKFVVFDDVRYVNEADKIRGLGGKIIRVNRFQHLNVYGKDLDIESETQLDKYSFDHIIHDAANQSLKDLSDQADLLVDSFL